jgi:hypothetical protein
MRRQLATPAEARRAVVVGRVLRQLATSAQVGQDIS